MKTFLLVATLILAGCQSAGQNTTPAPVDQQIDAQVDDLLASLGKQDRQGINGYAAQLKAAVEKEVHMGDEFRGKTCSVQIALDRDGAVTNASAVEGDPAFCEAILKAVRQAKLTPAPDEKTYQLLNNARLDFKP
jgi:colicin import membrane protein